MFSSDQKLLDACEEQNVDAYTDSVSALSWNTMTQFHYDVFAS